MDDMRPAWDPVRLVLQVESNECFGVVRCFDLSLNMTVAVWLERFCRFVLGDLSLCLQLLGPHGESMQAFATQILVDMET